MSTEQSTALPTAAPPRRLGVLVVVAVMVLALDIVSKIIVVAHLEGRPAITVVPGLLYLDVSRNPGAAFSMATGMTWVFSLVAVGVAGAIIWTAPRLRSVGWAIGLGLVLACALGNLTDRVFRAPGPMLGHVVDFISVFRPWAGAFPIFNLADSSLTVGAVLIIVMGLLGRDFDGGVARRQRLAAESGPSSPAGPDEPEDEPTE